MRTNRLTITNREWSGGCNLRYGRKITSVTYVTNSGDIKTFLYALQDTENRLILNRITYHEN